MNANEYLAEKLMGWVVMPNHTKYGIRATYEDLDGNYLMLRGDWNPHENIGQAFEVVENMRETGFHFRLTGFNYDNRYKVEFANNLGFTSNQSSVGFIWESEYNKNPATAITLAAAKALGWKEE